MDVAALGGGADVEVLEFAGGFEVVVGDGVGGGGVVGDVVRGCVVAVVEEDWGRFSILFGGVGEIL